MTWDQIVKKANAQVEECIILAQKYVLPWWGKTLREFYSPIPPSVHALYIAHECSMKYRLDGKLVFAPGRHLLTNYPEVGPDNLTAKKGDDEVRRWGKHPYDIRSHFWAAQQSFWEGKAWIEPILAKYGFPSFDTLYTQDELLLLLLPRAIGLGCTRGLLCKAKLETQQDLRGIGVWLAGPNADTTPFDGSQTTDVVRLRYLWCRAMISQAWRLGIGCLGTCAAPVLDPGNLLSLPKDFHANMKAYSRAAKNQGSTPTGSW